jgi:hypothetical protein
MILLTDTTSLYEHLHIWVDNDRMWPPKPPFLRKESAGARFSSFLQENIRITILQL